MQFSGDITGLPALLIFCLLIYLLIYVPLKLLTTIVAKSKQKVLKINQLQQQTIIAEYDPPANLTPAEIGYLYDAKLGREELFATIIWFEQQGMVQLTSEDNGMTIAATAQPVTYNNDFDRYVFSRLYQRSGQRITDHWLHGLARDADLKMKQNLQQKGYLRSTAEQVKSSGLRLVIITGLLVAAQVLLTFPHTANGWFAEIFFTFFLWPVYGFLGVLLYGVYSKAAGEPWLSSPQLKQLWPDIEGFRHFIEQAALDRLVFETETLKTVSNNKLLPYAIALGFSTGWRNKLG